MNVAKQMTIERRFGPYYCKKMFSLVTTEWKLLSTFLPSEILRILIEILAIHILTCFNWKVSGNPKKGQITYNFILISCKCAYASFRSKCWIKLSAFQTKFRALRFYTRKRNALKSKITNLGKCNVYHRVRLLTEEINLIYFLSVHCI